MENIIELAKDLSAVELDTLITRLKKLAESKQSVGIAKKEFYGYNGRRYGKPWIAKIISWPTGKQPKLEFGTYYGNDSGGTAEITAREGNIIRFGQKDNRGNGTINEWGVFKDGKIVEISVTEARELYRE